MTQAATPTRHDVNKQLVDRRLFYPYKKIWPYWASPTVARFKALAVKDPEKYKSYIRVIDSMLDLAKNKNVKMKLVLHLPSEDALMAIDIESLLQNPEARKEIVSGCYRPEEGKIDLRYLLVVSRRHRPDIRV